jgi:hypothetical protein
MDHFQVVFRVQLRCGSASVIPGVMTQLVVFILIRLKIVNFSHSPTDIIIEIRFVF